MESNELKGWKAEERQYHLMVEEVEDYAILMLDPYGYVCNWNKGAEKIKGYREEEIVGRHFSIFYPPEDQETGLPSRLLNQAMDQGKATHEGWRVRKNGNRFWGSIVITALHDELGNVVGFSKVTRDLTERKTAEDKMLRYARQLERQNKELQQFAYAAAHDMKEPLRKIQFYYSAITEGREPLSAEKQQQYLERSVEAARRMQALIDDLLAFSRVTETVEKYEMVDLNVIVDEVCTFYQDAIDNLGATVNYTRLPVLKAIPFQVRQLFVNLLGNSLKYHDEQRQLSIGITADEVRLIDENDTKIVRSYHHIVVRDNGIGFEPSQEKNIFRIFERLHGRDKYAGTGIGLAICKKIMDNHQGSIAATGLPGEGAVFEMYFPAE